MRRRVGRTDHASQCIRFRLVPRRKSCSASLSGHVIIRYVAVVENNVRRLLPKSGRQHLWSDLPSEVLPFLLPSRFCPSDKFMRFAQREFAGAGDGEARVMAMLEWIPGTSTM